MEGVEQTKVKYTHSEYTSRNPLNIDLEIINERQDCNIDRVGSTCGRRVNEGD
jgi:hypothetical protein